MSRHCVTESIFDDSNCVNNFQCEIHIHKDPLQNFVYVTPTLCEKVSLMGLGDSSMRRKKGLKGNHSSGRKRNKKALPH